MVFDLARDNFYRSLFFHSMDGVLLTAPDGRILAANPAACKMFGRTEAEICKVGRSGLMDSSDPNLAASLIERDRTGKVRAELSCIRADGTRFPSEISSGVFRDDEGNPRTAMIIRDVTERRQIEREREQYFKFFTLSTDPMCIADPYGRFKQVNPAFARLTGYAESELVSRPFLDFVVPEDRQKTAAEMELQVTTRPSMDFENRYMRKDGSVIVLSWTAYYDKNDGVTYATARDITERKHIEDALRYREADLHAAQRVAKIGNWRLTLATGAISWSKEIYRVFDRKPDLSPPNYAELDQFMTAASAQRMKSAIENTVQTGTAFEIDLELLRAEGTRKWIAARGEAVRDEDGHIIGLRGTAQDISERKEAENAIRQSNRALRVLSSCNQALVHAGDEQNLFHDVCRIIVDEGGYRLAWVGMAEHDAGKSVRPIAQYGFEEGYLDALGITWADGETGRGPTGTAIRTGSTQVNQHFATNPLVAPWREQALKRGYGSSIALPLKTASATLGALDVYAAEPNAFDRDEIRLLEELADDLAFGVTALRARAAHARAESALRKSEKKFKDLLESAPDAMVIVNRAAEIVLVNARAVTLFGWRREELLGQKLEKLIPGRFRVSHAGNENVFFAHPHLRPMGPGLKIFALRKNGNEFPADISLSPLETDEGTLAIAAIRDVTERTQALKALSDSEASYRSIFENANTPIAATDASGRVASFNEAFRAMLGYDAESLGRMNFADFTHADDLRLETVFFNEILARQREHYRMEKRYIAKDGRILWVDLSASAIRDRNGEVQKFVAVIVDITERKAAEREIAYLSRVHAVLSGINALIVRVSGRDELFRGACRIAVEQGGFRMSMIAMVDPESREIVPVASAGKDEELLGAIRAVLSSGEGAPATLTAMALRDKAPIVANDSQNDPRLSFGGKYAEAGVRSLAVLPLVVADEAVGVFALYAREIAFFHAEEMKLLTELTGDIAFAIDHIEKQARLDYLAYYDALTGLANRSLFLERVAQYLRSAASGGHKLAVFLIDLARFKNINDSLGRVAGDALLRQVADWLTRSAGDANLVARVGVDLFALVMPQVMQGGDVARLLEKWTKAFLEHPFHLNDAEFRISARAGIAIFPDDGTDVETLFKNAEVALKQAKSSGDRYLFYARKMNEAVARKLTLENQLRHALDNEEFVLHYQPKVRLLTGALTGAEALIRWNDPRSGLIAPGEFIPILEETGLISEIGHWALRQAIEDYLRWLAAGLPAVRIAVNVSPLQLRNRAFLDQIGQAVAIDAQAPAGLELEITESLVMEDIKHNTTSLQAIRAMGVSVAIDDFGTGFSSLSYLAKLPVDTLKIDRSFVIDMSSGPDGAGLVSTIINLAHSLKLKVVAEGVETAEQLRLLRLLDCDEVQGFLIGKPVPGDVFATRFLASPLAGDSGANPLR